MKNMNTRAILTHSITLLALAIPAIVSAHGGVDDSHMETLLVNTPRATGASALLMPWSGRWFGLLAVSLLITSLLSYWVYRYIQVAPIEKKKIEEKK